jgi:hypothetical protein
MGRHKDYELEKEERWDWVAVVKGWVCLCGNTPARDEVPFEFPYRCGQCQYALHEAE